MTLWPARPRCRAESRATTTGSPPCQWCRAHQAGIINVVEDKKGSKAPAADCRGPGVVIRIFSGPPNYGPSVHVDLDVALHYHRARQVNSSGKIEHATLRPGGNLADGLIDFRGFEGLARAVHLVVLDIDHVFVAEPGRIFLRRFGKQHQPGVVESWFVVEKKDQITRPIEIETDLVPVDLGLDAVGERPHMAGEHLPFADEQGDLNVDLTGHGETGVVHPVELVVSQETMHKHRLTIDCHLVRIARHRVRVRRIRGNFGKGGDWPEHQEQSQRKRKNLDSIVLPSSISRPRGTDRFDGPTSHPAPAPGRRPPGNKGSDRP